jgi:glycosyltransferase involved in cell wall biosynthesis
MRIALIAPGIPDYSLEFAQIVSRSANTLLCIADKNLPSEWPRAHSRLEIERALWPRQRYPIANIRFLLHLARRIRTWKPDVVHLLMEDNVWTNLLPFLLRSVPFVTTVHDVELHPGDTATAKVPRHSITALVKRSTAIVVHGRNLRAHAARLWPEKAGRCFVFPHPPLRFYKEIADQIAEPKRDDGVFRLLFFGRIYDYKGVRYLLEAARSVQEVSSCNLDLVIAGGGRGFAAYRHLASDLRCLRVYDEYIPAQMAARLFAGADAVVLPYIEGSQSGVLMLAMAFRLPVISTDAGEIGDTVRETGMGMVVPPRDSASLAAAIVRLASDPELRARFSSNAERALKGRYSIPSLADMATQIYSAVSGRREVTNTVAERNCLTSDS